MENLIRMTCAVNRVNSGNPADCLEEILQLLEGIDPEENGIVLLPKLALCGDSAGSLFSHATLAAQCVQALDALREATCEREGYLIAGLLWDDFGRPASVMAVLHKGELVGLVPTTDNRAPLISAGFSDFLLPVDTVFSCGSVRFCLLGCDPLQVPLLAPGVAQTGCDLILVPACAPVYAGYTDEALRGIQAASRATGCAIAVANGGVGETSSPWVYRGFVAVFEAGRELRRTQGGSVSFAETIDFDLDVIHAEKRCTGYREPAYAMEGLALKSAPVRPVSRNPFLPRENAGAYLYELFDLQVRSLAARMENIGVSRLVAGVSGGLDSTAVMLCCARAADLLGLPRENIIGITMPGFGTSDRTYYNALSLLENLGVTRRDISIRPAVQQHFEDIGHSGAKDTTYENAQARERAQILLDVANQVGGIVVGSGDLSEESLGFCTFAGDQIANYNVNVCITKTMLREMVRHVVEQNLVNGAGSYILDILETPVSPELLPPSEDGEIEQKTEEILGPYELHDFFLYYFVKYRMRPRKILDYACLAFEELDRAYICDRLRLFFRRFCAAQFKRACAPDSASITEVNLNAVNFAIPSDLDSTVLLRELDTMAGT